MKNNQIEVGKIPVGQMCILLGFDDVRQKPPFRVSKHGQVQFEGGLPWTELVDSDGYPFFARPDQMAEWQLPNPETFTRGDVLGEMGYRAAHVHGVCEDFHRDEHDGLQRKLALHPDNHQVLICSQDGKMVWYLWFSDHKIRVGTEMEVIPSRG